MDDKNETYKRLIEFEPDVFEKVLKKKSEIELREKRASASLSDAVNELIRQIQ